MEIQVVVDRIEDEDAVLVDEETGIEIRVHVSSVIAGCGKGETFSIAFDDKMF